MAARTKANAGAIILALLDPETTKELLRRMSPDDVRRLLSGLQQMQCIDDADIDQACTAFLAAATASEPHHGASQVRANQNRLVEWLEAAGVKQQPQDPFWSDLRGADLCAQIRRVVAGIAPQTLAQWAAQNADGPVATLLGLLESASGAAVLTAVPIERAVRLLLHMTAQQHVDDESLVILLEDLRELQLRESHLGRSHPFGESRALELLRALDPPARDRVLAGLGDRDAPLAERLNSGLLKFEQLAQLSRADLSLVLSGFHERLLATALKGQPAEIRASFLAAVSARRRETIEGEQATLGPVRVSDQQDVHRSLTDRARMLRESGRISFPWDDQMVS